MADSRAEYMKDWRDRQRATRKANVQIALAAIERLAESACKAGPEDALEACKLVYTARRALEAA